jgi:hypothetical protein
MTQPILVLAEGTLKYQGGPGGWDTFEDRTCRVFIVEWHEGGGGTGQSWATVILREPAYFQNERQKPVPAGAIRKVFAGGGDFETLLTVDVEALTDANGT